MKIYLAASYSRREEMCSYAKILREDGYEVTSRWLTGEGELHTEQWCAEQDLEDLEAADVQINFSDSRLNRGGRQVELGLGLAGYNLHILLVGPREHVFHYLPDVEVYSDFNAAREALPGIQEEIALVDMQLDVNEALKHERG